MVPFDFLKSWGILHDLRASLKRESLMLHVQRYLQEKSLEELEAELGIKACQHDTKPLVILNYNQIDSPKGHKIVRETRGLVLHSETFEVVARAFPRFFNWGEMQDEMPLFNFKDFISQSKEDGSLFMLFNFEDEWFATTRGSFGGGLVQHYDITWREMAQDALGISSLSELDAILNPRLTYVCEIVGVANKVVRAYTENKLYLLTIFDGLSELGFRQVDTLAVDLPFLRPNVFHFKRMDEIQAHIMEIAANDPTNEGVVIRDNENRRWKIKSPTYQAYHRMRGEGDNLYHPKNLLPSILLGELDELFAIFPESEDVATQYKDIVDKEFDVLVSVWESAKHLEVQRDFALAIIGKTPFTGVLFNFRGAGKDGVRELRKTWIASEGSILKWLMRQPRIIPSPPTVEKAV